MAVIYPIASDLSLEQLPDVERTFYFTGAQNIRQDIWDFFDGERDSLRDYTVFVKKFPLESLDTDRRTPHSFKLQDPISRKSPVIVPL